MTGGTLIALLTRGTFSFVWEWWGRQTPDRNAAVDVLFAAQERK